MKKVLNVREDKQFDSTEVTIRVPEFQNFGQRLQELEQKAAEALEDEPLDPEVLSSAVAKLNAITEQALKKMPDGPQKEMLLKLMKETDEAVPDDDDEDDDIELQPRKEKPVDLQQLRVQLPDGMKWDKAQEAIVDQFLADWPKLRPEVLKQTAKYYKKHYPDVLEFLGEDAGTKFILPKPGTDEIVADLFRISTVYIRDVWSSTLSNSPAWDAEKTPPPLSPKRAGVLAVESAYVQLGNHPAWPQMRFGEPGWRVDEVSLVQAVHDDSRWYYRVRVRSMAPGSGSGAAVTLFVTLDGKVQPLTGRPPRQKRSRI